MPLYEYKCKKGHTFDVIQSFSDDSLSKCEICGAKAERVLSAPAIHFKGSGFYNTDYGTKRRTKEKEANASKEKAAKADSSSSSSDSASSGSDSSSASSSSSSTKTEATASSASASKD